MEDSDGETWAKLDRSITESEEICRQDAEIGDFARTDSRLEFLSSKASSCPNTVLKKLFQSVYDSLVDYKGLMIIDRQTKLLKK